MCTMYTLYNIHYTDNVLCVNMKKPIKKKTYHHGNLKQTLIDVSLDILVKEGHQSLSIRKVATQAGVSQSAPYRHFIDQEALYAEVACVGFQRLSDVLQELRKKYKKTPLIQFRESGVIYVEFALNNPALFQIMYGNQIPDHSKYPFLIESEDQTFQILLDILTDCKNEGSIQTDDIQGSATSAWTLVHGIAVLLSGKQVMFRSTDLKKARKVTKDLIQFLYVGMSSKSN
jgi:AcrR family transcriptional regulator